MKKIITLVLVLIISSIVSLSTFAASISEYSTVGAVNVVRSIAEKRFASSLYGYFIHMRDSNGGFLHVKFSNGTKTKYTMSAKVVCKDPSGNVLRWASFKEDLGFSLYGAVERARNYKVDCPAPNKLDLGFGNPIPDKFVNLEPWNIVLVAASIYFGTFTF